MYTIEEFDREKTKVLKYIIYKKRTEQEIRQKFSNTINEEMLEDIIEYLKEAKYIDDKEFIEQELDVSNLSSQEELIENINKNIYPETQLVKIILIGTRHFEIDVFKIYQFIESSQIIKLKDKTKPFYDLEKLQNEMTLKGMFAKEMLEKLQDVNEEEKEILEKTIEVAFEALQ